MSMFSRDIEKFLKDFSWNSGDENYNIWDEGPAAEINNVIFLLYNFPSSLQNASKTALLPINTPT